MNKPVMKVGVTVGIIAAALMASPAVAQDEGTSVNTRISTQAQTKSLFGEIAAPFDTGAPEERPCESGRTLVVSMKSDTGRFKRVATVDSSPEGTWKTRVPRSKAVYRISVLPADFTFSAQYGELQEGRCLPATVTGRLANGKFKLLGGVLGTRFSRSGAKGGGAPLPRTGVPVAPILVGLGLIGTGGLTLMVGGRRKEG